MITLDKLCLELDKNLKFNILNYKYNIDNYSDIKVENINSLDAHDNKITTLTWLNYENLYKLNEIIKGIIIIGLEEFLINKDFEGIILRCENPRQAFSLALKLFNNEDEDKACIGTGCVIEDGVIIGLNVKIGYNNVIYRNTIIGDNVSIGSNNTIGGIGFGYEKDKNGQYQKIIHIGNVIIEDGVEIGNNNCIDRAVVGSTVLKNNCKIDNLVHIAHGAIIGENSLIIANSMIAGSCKVGKNVWVAPSTSIRNGIKIGDNAMTGLGAVVVSDVEANALVVGVPAKKIRSV